MATSLALSPNVTERLQIHLAQVQAFSVNPEQIPAPLMLGTVTELSSAGLWSSPNSCLASSQKAIPVIIVGHAVYVIYTKKQSSVLYLSHRNISKIEPRTLMLHDNVLTNLLNTTVKTDSLSFVTSSKSSNSEGWFTWGTRIVRQFFGYT